jgi:hypothetical protein
MMPATMDVVPRDQLHLYLLLIGSELDPGVLRTERFELLTAFICE